MTFLENCSREWGETNTKKTDLEKYRESEFTKIDTFIHGYFMATND